MLNTKKTTHQSTHWNEVAYSGTVTAVTHKTIVIFIPVLDVDVDVRRDPDASVQNVFVVAEYLSNLNINRIIKFRLEFFTKRDIIEPSQKVLSLPP